MTQDSGDVAVDYEIDGDVVDHDAEDGQPVARPFISARMGGKVYKVYQPKIMSWLKIVKVRRSRGDDQVVALLDFLEASFTYNDKIELEERFNEPTDPIDADTFLRVLDACFDRWEPDLAKQAAAMGLRQPPKEVPNAPVQGRASARRR